MNDILIKKAKEHAELLAIIRECQRHPIDLFKSGYNPDEPRDYHGRWTSGDDDSHTIPDGTENDTIVQSPDTSAIGFIGAISSSEFLGAVAAAMALIPGVGEAEAGTIAAWEAFATVESEATAASATAEAGSGLDWTLGQYKSPTRWGNQLTSRGWTPAEITDTIIKGESSAAPNFINKGNTATNYEITATGRFVVRDDVTGEIIQVSGKNFDPLKTLIHSKNHLDHYTTYRVKNSKKLKQKKLKKMSKTTTRIYIYLLDEGTPTVRPTEAIDLGGGRYKILPTDSYNPNDETWEFLPGSIVRCERADTAHTKNILLAVEKVA